MSASNLWAASFFFGWVTWSYTFLVVSSSECPSLSIISSNLLYPTVNSKLLSEFTKREKGRKTAVFVEKHIITFY